MIVTGAPGGPLTMLGCGVSSTCAGALAAPSVSTTSRRGTTQNQL